MKAKRDKYERRNVTATPQQWRRYIAQATRQDMTLSGWLRLAASEYLDTLRKRKDVK